MSFRFPLLLGLLAAALLACSGAATSDLLTGDGTHPDQGNPSPPDSGAADSGSPDSGLPGQDAEPPPDVFTPPPDVSVPDTNPPPPPPPPPFRCGTDQSGHTLVCSGAAPTCCADQGDGVIMQTSYACTATAGACMSGGPPFLAVQCHDEADCGGQFCCGANDGMQYLSLQCSPTCDSGDAGAVTYIRFCNPNNAGACADLGLSCVASTLLPGFYHCG